MSRKDYEAIAESFDHALAEVERDSESPIRIATLAKELADKFAKDNPAFNRARFLLACGVIR